MHHQYAVWFFFKALQRTIFPLSLEFSHTAFRQVRGDDVKAWWCPRQISLTPHLQKAESENCMGFVSLAPRYMFADVKKLMR